jgi:hypothetical protein
MNEKLLFNVINPENFKLFKAIKFNIRKHRCIVVETTNIGVVGVVRGYDQVLSLPLPSVVCIHVQKALKSN